LPIVFRLTIIVTMLMVNIAEAKAKLSEYVDAVAKGEHVIICNRNRPVAELRAIEAPRKAPRDLTPMFPDWKIDPAFFDPLTDAEIAEWEGTPIESLRTGARAPEYGAPVKQRRTRR
jgi:prevent-host-death family protein